LKSSFYLQSRNILLFLVFLVSFQSCLAYHSLPLPFRKQKGTYHTVKKNQNLWRICKAYNVSLQEVAEINNIKRVSQIKAGDKIFIPGATKVRWVSTAKHTKQIRKKFSSKNKIIKHTGIFSWPLKGKVVKKFGVYNGVKHDGINIKASYGSSVKASYSGKVVFSSHLEGYGNTVIIQHKNKYATVYANNKVNHARKGQWIKTGHKISTVGTSAGNSKTPYLHFQIRKNNRARNPLFYLPKH
jgi:murein DD-endopeptidase MepM/ murein hydrolase activator NlpD